MSLATRAPDDSIEVTSLIQWRAWLQEHHGRRAGVWLITYREGASRPRLEYEHAVCEALCWGWVASLPKKLDDDREMLRFAPRSARTGWSAVNKRRVAKMAAANRMQPMGLAKVEAAKADGSWWKSDRREPADQGPPTTAADLKRWPRRR